MWFRRKQWWEIGSWVGVVGGKRYWMPLYDETLRRDIPHKYRTERAAILAERRLLGESLFVREMTPDSPRVVCQHTRVDAENCPEYAHTIEAIAAELDDDPGF